MSPRDATPLLVLALASACVSGGASSPEPATRMTAERLQETLRAVDPEAKASGNSLELGFAEVRMVCVFDERNDRMRIIAPIRSLADLSSEQLAAILDANFHSALDARYGTSQGILYAAFLHPLGPLTEREILSAVHQVASLVLTFGTSYSSGTLVYQDPGQAL